MKHAKRSLRFALLSSAVGIFLFLSSVPAQEKAAPAEPAKMEAPATAPAAPAARNEERRSWSGAGAVHARASRADRQLKSGT
jgi:hypothetical protein